MSLVSQTDPQLSYSEPVSVFPATEGFLKFTPEQPLVLRGDFKGTQEGNLERIR